MASKITPPPRGLLKKSCNAGMTAMEFRLGEGSVGAAYMRPVVGRQKGRVAYMRPLHTRAPLNEGFFNNPLRGSEFPLFLGRNDLQWGSDSNKVSVQSDNANIKRFPADFTFQFTKPEYDDLRSQIVTSSRGGRRYQTHPPGSLNPSFFNRD